MIEIIEFNMNVGGRRHVVATAETFTEAKAKVESMGVAFMEDDADYIDCADAYMSDGRVLAIQPVGFTVKDSALWAKGKAMAQERRDAMASFDAEYGIGRK